MMRFVSLIALAFLLETPAIAQQQQGQTAMDQALSARIVQEINANIQCSSNVLELKQQIATLSKETDALKAKCGKPCEGLGQEPLKSH